MLVFLSMHCDSIAFTKGDYVFYFGEKKNISSYDLLC